MNSTRTVNSSRNSLFLQYPRKAGGQVTVAATVTAIMTNHCSSQKEKNFTRVKADSFRDFRKHPMLLSAYLKELIPQYSAGSKLLPQQQKSFREAPFHSRNTLPQPSFRNSLLNTVLCKATVGYLFYFTFRFTWFQSPVA